MRPVRKMQKDGFVFVQASRSSSPGTASASRPAKEADPASSSETVNLSLDSLLRGCLGCAAQSSELHCFPQLLHFLFLSLLLFLKLCAVVPHVPALSTEAYCPMQLWSRHEQLSLSGHSACHSLREDRGSFSGLRCNPCWAGPR